MIEAWRRSGDPAPVFARRHGLQARRLKYWADRLSRPEASPATLALVPATVVGGALAAVIHVGEVTIELSSTTAEQVAVVAQALARPTP